MRDSSTSHRFNELKYKILKALNFSKGYYYTPAELAEIAGISEHAMSQALSRLVVWGYIWRKIEYRKSKKNKYIYAHPKPKGSRVFTELDKRMKIKHYTGIFVSMKLKEPIPDIAQRRYDEMLHKG